MEHKRDQPTTPPSTLHIECLLVEAKVALLQDRLARPRTLHREDHHQEATIASQCEILLSALQLLKDSMAILERITNVPKDLDTQNPSDRKEPPLGKEEHNIPILDDNSSR